jgi:hypothetical protein
MHEDAWCTQEKEQTNLKGDFFPGRYNRHHQQGILPRDPRSCREKSWLDYRIFMYHVDPVDTTNKRFLLDTTNKGFLFTLTMMNFRRASLLGWRQEIVHPRRILKLEEGKREDSKLAKVRGEKHKGKEKNADLLRVIQRIFSKIVWTLDSTTSVGKVILQADRTSGYRQNLALIPLVTPQNRHLAYRSEHATIYMMSLWKRTTKRLVHVGACTWCGWNGVATVTQVHDGTHKRI